MDIFMFLNKNNDEYLDTDKIIETIKGSVSIGDDEEKLQYQLYQVNHLFNDCTRGSINYVEFVNII